MNTVKALRGKAFSFLPEYDVSRGSVIYDFYNVKIRSLYTNIVESFYHEWMWISMAFSASIEIM